MPLYLNGVETSVGPNIVSPIISGGTINNCVIGGSTPAAIAGTTGTFSGIVQGAINIIDIGENTDLTAAQCLGSLVRITGAYTVTLPPASTVAEGGHVTFYCTSANVGKVDLYEYDRFVLDGTVLDVDHMLNSPGAAGDYITVVREPVGWTVIGRYGVWVDGGTS